MKYGGTSGDILTITEQDYTGKTISKSRCRLSDVRSVVSNFRAIVDKYGLAIKIEYDKEKALIPTEEEFKFF